MGYSVILALRSLSPLDILSFCHFFFSFNWQILEEVEEVVTVYDSEGEGVTSDPAPFQLGSSADPLSYTR